MASSDPIRRIGRRYDQLRTGVKQSNPLLKKVPLVEVDNFIAQQIWDNLVIRNGKKKKK